MKAKILTGTGLTIPKKGDFFRVTALYICNYSKNSFLTNSGFLMKQ